MRFVSSVRWLVAGTLLVDAGAATACGSATPTPRPPMPNGQALLLASVDRTDAQSYRARASGELAESRTGGPASGARTGFTAHFDVDAQVASPTQMVSTVGLTGAGQGSVETVVRVGDEEYLSFDGGTTWTRHVAAAGSEGAFTPDRGLATLRAVASVTDRGPGTADGVGVERYTAVLDPAKLAAALGGLAGATGRSPGSGQPPAVPVMNGTIDGAIDGAGRLVTLDGTVTLIYRSAGPGASGGSSVPPLVVNMKETFNEHIYDYGAVVVVTPPPGTEVSPAPLQSGGG